MMVLRVPTRDWGNWWQGYKKRSGLIVEGVRMAKQTKPRREPGVGEVFTHRLAKRMYVLTVVSTAEGLGYQLEGVVYRSPTAAAKALVGNDTSINGRSFWGLDRPSRVVSENAG